MYQCVCTVYTYKYTVNTHSYRCIMCVYTVICIYIYIFIYIYMYTGFYSNSSSPKQLYYLNGLLKVHIHPASRGVAALTAVVFKRPYAQNFVPVSPLFQSQNPPKTTQNFMSIPFRPPTRKKRPKITKTTAI